MSEPNTYGEAASDAELADAERILGCSFPGAWRRFLQRPRRFARGWMHDDFVVLDSAIDCARGTEVVGEFPGREGMIVVGGDGSREMLVIDARKDDSPVYLVDITGGWDDAIEQAPSIDEFLARIDAGSFAFVFED